MKKKTPCYRVPYHEFYRNLQGGDPEKVRENQRKRFKDPASVDKIIELDNSWRQAR